MRIVSALALALVVAACASTPPPVVVADDAATEETAMTTDNADALQVTLLPLKSTSVGGAVLVQMQVHNPSTKAARFCTYHTLFEGLRNDIFGVKTADGVEVDYQGIMAKRAPPGRTDFKTVAPGETIVSDPVDIGPAYPLPAGTATILFEGNAISGLSASAPVTVDVAAP